MNRSRAGLSIVPTALDPIEPEFEATSGIVSQFTTLDSAGLPCNEHCWLCSSSIPGKYYLINGKMACYTCARQASEGQPANCDAAFARSLNYGIAGAIIGLILCTASALLTGWTFGCFSLAAGCLVGACMKKGSNGVGGRRFQVVAVLLTYAAISLAAIPVGISNALKNHVPGAIVRHIVNPVEIDTYSSDASDASPASTPSAAEAVSAQLHQLVIHGLASPFLEFAGGNIAGAAIGLFVLFVGLRIAWTTTRARTLAVFGPYTAADGNPY